ncbi:hypothetical protein J4233_01405 [Candidatus Pacearchaeota archaeon]|nr:hypothetical protein [Candidatus Pacearchaeota archaeon]
MNLPRDYNRADAVEQVADRVRKGELIDVGRVAADYKVPPSEARALFYCAKSVAGQKPQEFLKRYVPNKDRDNGNC